MYYEKHYNIIIIVILMAFCAFSTIGKGAMMGSNFVPAPTGLAYTASSATTTAVTISFSMASIAGTTTYISSTGTGSGGPSAYTISTLSSNTPYTITLIAKNNGISSKASTSVSVLTVPGPPTIGTATLTDATHVSVNFTAPGGTGTITGYTVTSNTGSFTGTGTSSPITVTGTFVSGTAYTFTVTATNASGTSTSSGASASVTPNVGFTVIYTPGLIWTAFYNDFGSSTTSTFINNTGVGTPGTGGVALTKAPIGTTWGAANNPAIAQNTGVVTDFTSLQTNTNGIILSSGFNNFSVEWTGYFLANATGLWTFTISSDDGSLLWINNDTTQYAMNGYTYANATVNNSYYQGQTARSNTANLTSGNYYFIRIQFYQGGGGYNLVFTATNPSGTIIGPNLSGYVFNIPDGLTSATAAPSAVYLAASGNTTNGTYWITLPTVGPTQVYCILDRAVDGGGWMMAMKAATGTTFNYSANYWTTNNTLNPTDTTRNTGSTNTDAKYNTMNYSAASDLLALWPDITTVGGSLTLTSYGCWSWLQNRFTTSGTPYVGTGTSGVLATTTVSGITLSMTLIDWFNKISSIRYFIQDAKTWSGWNSSIFSGQDNIRFYGFNFIDNGNHNVRWGFGWNNEGSLFPNVDLGSDDVAGGIGMVNNSYSAGDYFTCCGTTGVNRTARVEMYIRDSSSAPSPPTSVSSSISGTTATITFTGSTGASYYTAFSNTGGFSGSSTSSPITVTGLTSGTSYTFTVKASNASGTSLASAPVVTVYFSYTGADQTFTVPAGITTLLVQCWGAGGGSAGHGNITAYSGGGGGGGGYSSATFTVTPSSTVKIIVGQGGQYGNSGAACGFTYGGGGAEFLGDGNWGSASGGGRSAIQLLVSSTYVEIITAGGGGGAGNNQPVSNSSTIGGGGAGGGAVDGMNGGNATGNGTEIGYGGTQSAGGAGGGVDAGSTFSGTQYTGGGNTSTSQYGAGGGGGWYGGGSGGIRNGWYFGGGGGGSSYVNSTYVKSGTSGTISYIGGSASTVGNNAGLPSGIINTIGNGAKPATGSTTSSAANIGQNGYVIITY